MILTVKSIRLSGYKRHRTDVSVLAISTSFLTVTISNVVPDWLQAGNFDPHIAWQLAQADYTATSGAILPRMKAELLRRGNRFLAQSEMMRPRGQRIPWWKNSGENSGVGNTNGTNDGGNRTAGILLQGTVDNSAETAKKRLV